MYSTAAPPTARSQNQRTPEEFRQKCLRQNPRATQSMKARLYERYVNDVRPALKQKRGYTNEHQVPKLEKIVVNMGISASLEKGALEDAAKDLQSITGRKAAVSKSRHSIANFKL